MTALWILLAALLVVLLAGLGCFALACARRPQPDMADPAVLKQSKYAPLADEILSGIAFWRAQEPEDIFLPSFDGLRLHGQLVQQPESKGTILLFHGYRSSWVIDFSIVLPYYHSLGYDLLVVDERAHGQSEGDYITFGVRERRDVVTWAQYAAMHFGPAHPLILDGLSMGAATVLMASELALPASVRSVAKVVMQPMEYYKMVKELTGGAATLFGRPQESMLGFAVVLCDYATQPIVGDLKTIRVNYDDPLFVKSDEDIDTDVIKVVINGDYDIQVEDKNRLRRVKVAAA